MKTRQILFGIALILTASVASFAQEPTNEERAAAWFEAHRARPVMARMFLQRMPKGGDIHTHLSGAVYAESYLAWAADAKLCANTATGAIVACGAPSSEARPVADALRDPALYSLIVDGLSTRNLANQPQSGHDQFFDAFAKFRAATKDRSADMVAELTTRAADQNVTYVEIMLTIGGDALWTLAGKVRFDANDFAASRQRLIDAGLAEAVKAGRAELDTLEQQIDAVLGCGRQPRPPACGVGRRYLEQASRTSEPNRVFAQLVYGFELARADRRVVGVNMVAPEDFLVARRDYSLHMRMVGWLNDLHGTVKVALHAGELTLGLVPPADLRFHIREAVEVAKARRIGHGVDIAYERDALQLLAEMKRRDVLVEICLTSNDVILGVRGSRHPFPEYMNAGVPVTLATDDEGVSRIDLTHEYVRAAETYGLGYRQLKQLSRNSLTYSFLAGDSLWRSAPDAQPVPACAGQRPDGQPSPECRSFLDGSDKARLQWDLERAFHAFEALGWPAEAR
jgi:adenosine deaminase/adenosine deaminase CECR1